MLLHMVHPRAAVGAVLAVKAIQLEAACRYRLQASSAVMLLYTSRLGNEIGALCAENHNIRAEHPYGSTARSW
jgi:hypothetical protein